MPLFTKYRKFTVAIEWLLSGYCVAIEWLLSGYWISAYCTTSLPRHAHIDAYFCDMQVEWERNAKPGGPRMNLPTHGGNNTSPRRFPKSTPIPVTTQPNKDTRTCSETFS